MLPTSNALFTPKSGKLESSNVSFLSRAPPNVQSNLRVCWHLFQSKHLPRMSNAKIVANLSRSANVPNWFKCYNAPTPNRHLFKQTHKSTRCSPTFFRSRHKKMFSMPHPNPSPKPTTPPVLHLAVGE